MIDNVSDENPNASLSIRFLNIGHLLDHYVILIFPTVVIGLEAVYQTSYGQLLTLSWAAFAAIGIFALPFGWLADHWSRRNMMALFFLGTGISAIAVGLAPNFTTLAIALFFVGVFAAIYHPVGIPMLLEQAVDRGRVMAFNGVAGNFGVAIAAVCTGALTSLFGWRFAFFIPAAVFLVAGIAYLRLVPKDSQRRIVKPHADDVAVDPRMVMIFVALIMVMSTTGGFVFNILTIILPKVVDVRGGTNMPLVIVSSLATAIFLCGAVAQLSVGRLLGRIPAHILLASLALTQFVALWWVTFASGWALIAALGISMAAIYGQVTVNDIVLGRYTPTSIRGRVYAARFFLIFAPSGPGVWWVSRLYDTSGLDAVLWLMMATAAIFAVASMVLSMLASAIESRRALAQAAE
jgi:MFS family permease